MTHFTIGQELSHGELREAYAAMFGKPLPKGRAPREVAGILSRACALRFEYEVNRLRGHAWEGDFVVLDRARDPGGDSGARSEGVHG